MYTDVARWGACAMKPVGAMWRAGGTYVALLKGTISIPPELIKIINISKSWPFITRVTTVQIFYARWSPM